ncbi:hypothetical protein D9M72_375270 [compost metagenome]
MRDTEVQQPKVTATLSLVISWRAFSANSGQFEAGSTTTGSSLRPSTPPLLLISSMVIRATSFSDVSEMAMVPDNECRMPTLIGSLDCASASGLVPIIAAAAIADSFSMSRRCILQLPFMVFVRDYAPRVMLLQLACHGVPPAFTPSQVACMADPDTGRVCAPWPCTTG